jgi:single-strand DNA-binding protein
MSLPTMTIVGTVTADPELRFIPSGAAVANFTVAANERRKNKDTGEWEDGSATFIRCNVWRQHAENVAESLTRGMRVIVTGRLKQREYQTSEGEKRTVFDLEVDEVGPTLQWATAKVNKVRRDSAGAPSSSSASPADDPWGSAPPAVSSQPVDDEPPF